MAVGDFVTTNLDEETLKKTLKSKIGGMIPNPSKAVTPDEIKNVIAFAMSQHLPGMIAESLSINDDMTLDLLNQFTRPDLVSKFQYGTSRMQEVGYFMEKLLFGIPKDSKPMPDLLFTKIQEDLQKEGVRIGYQTALNKSVSDTIDKILSSEYIKDLYNIDGFKLLNKTIDDAGPEIKTYSKVQYGLVAGGFPVAKALANDDIEVITEAVKKLYYKMSYLFLMSMSYGTATGDNKKMLIFRGATVFYELIWDKLVQSLIVGTIKVQQITHSINSPTDSFRVIYDFKAAYDVYKNAGHSIIQQVKDMGLYNQHSDLWGDAGSRSQFFSDVVQYMKDTGRLFPGTQLSFSKI